MLFGLRRKRDRCAEWLRAPEAGSSSLTGHDPACRCGTRRPDDRLGAVVERSGTALLVRAGGSVDASNVALWRRLIAEAATATVAPGPLVVDTKALEFMAVCAFAVLIDEAARCRALGITLYLVSDQPVVARVLSAAGLDSELSLAVSVDEVLGGVPRRESGPVLGR